MSISPPVQVTFTDRFENDIQRLGKRYRRIRLDIQPLIEQLESGELLGAQMSGMDYAVFKVRVRNSSTQKGKYYLKTLDRILLVTIYAKSDKADITAAEVREILVRAEAGQ
jgi:mRNA-degrading endonuclease RelE of RelBE toxin-antitoxin system